jgi:hypothetical protein
MSQHMARNLIFIKSYASQMALKLSQRNSHRKRVFRLHLQIPGHARKHRQGTRALRLRKEAEFTIRLQFFAGIGSDSD